MAEKMTAEERAAKMRARMRGVKHALWGSGDVTPMPGTVFNPLHSFYDPGFFTALLSYFLYRATRAGVGAGLPKRLARAAREEAAQRAMRLFTERDYAAEGVTADECFRAIMSTARRMDRAQWRDDAEDRDARGDGKRQWFPWNRGQDSRTGNPSRMVAAMETLPADMRDEGREAIVGADCDERQTGTVEIPGGKRQPPMHGKMVALERVARSWVETMHMVPVETLAAGGGLSAPEPIPFQEIETGWRMDRRRGKAQTYPACAVVAAADIPAGDRPRFSRPPLPPMRAWSEEDGLPVCNRETARDSRRPAGYAADPERYREALAEYYAGK